MFVCLSVYLHVSLHKLLKGFQLNCHVRLFVCLPCLSIYLLVSLHKLLKGFQLNWLLVSMIKIVARIRVLHIVIYIKLKYNHVSQEGSIDVHKTGLS